jgi:hypothetical protein
VETPTRPSRRTLLAGLALVPVAWPARALAAAAGAVPAASPAAPAPGAPPAAALYDATSPSAIPPGFPRQHPDRVRNTVGLAHRDLDGVRALVESTPALANATWDWGFGDWETPLGAASHTGRREIALYLLERGAHPTLFSAAMLGQLAVVRATLEATPAARATRGPHGIPLVEHARAGGEAARAVLDYLESLPPLPPSGPAAVELPAAERRRYLGRYRYGADDGKVFDVVESRDALGIKSGGDFERRLTPLGGHEFHPPGAPAVRIRFTVGGAEASALEVRDGELVVTARRIG